VLKNPKTQNQLVVFTFVMDPEGSTQEARSARFAASSSSGMLPLALAQPLVMPAAQRVALPSSPPAPSGVGGNAPLEAAQRQLAKVSRKS